MLKQAFISLFAATLLSGCVGRQHTFDGDPWLELRSEHFVVRSQAGAADASAAIQQLERVRAALLLASWHGAVLPAERISVILLDSEAAMRELFPPHLQGVATQDPFGDLFPGLTPESGRRTAARPRSRARSGAARSPRPGLTTRARGCFSPRRCATRRAPRTTT